MALSILLARKHISYTVLDSYGAVLHQRFLFEAWIVTIYDSIREGDLHLYETDLQARLKPG